MDDLLRSICLACGQAIPQASTLCLRVVCPRQATGHRQLFETGCQAPESVTATDQELLQALAEEMHEDFAISGVTRFAVAYLAHRVTVIKPLDPNSSMRPTTTRLRAW